MNKILITISLTLITGALGFSAFKKKALLIAFLKSKKFKTILKKAL
jgi:hypothetical protein